MWWEKLYKPVILYLDLLRNELKTLTLEVNIILLGELH